MKHWPFDPLIPMKYGAILCDPPWSYEMYSDKGYEKSPEAHYGTMSDVDLLRLPVIDLASRDCTLFMWAIWPKLPFAIDLMKAWGFTYKTGGSWSKRTRHGKAAFGTGYIYRSSTEPWIVGTIGKPRHGSKSIRNLIEGERREHSRKPPEMRKNIELLCPNDFCAELFAREPWPGNDGWGNQTNLFEGDAA